MSEKLLLIALVLLDRQLDEDCGEIEHYELDAEINLLLQFMQPSDVGYFQAVLDICNFAHSL